MILAVISALTLASAQVDSGCLPPALSEQTATPALADAQPIALVAAPIVPLPTTPLPPSPPPSSENAVTDLVVTARVKAPPSDPLMAINAKSFAVTQAVDDAIVGPAAKVYTQGLPKPVRSGLHNALSNLGEPDIAINFMLQLKPGKALVAVARFTINSTVGVLGLFDIAKRRPFKLQHTHNSFADTLGVYGVKPGPFFFMPLIGPTTLRDLVGNAVDRLVLPMGIGAPFNKPAYSVSSGLVSALDYRSNFDEQLHKIRAQSDSYTAAREYYLNRRQAEIDGLRGIHRPVTVPSLANPPAPASFSRPPC